MVTERSSSLDALRLVAAVGVIWWHVASLSEATAKWGIAGHFAVPFFVCAAVALTVASFGREREKSLAAYAWSRVVRIYVPFLFWTLVYLVLRDAKYGLSGQPLVPLRGALLVAGSAHHLWFLPFVLLATVAAAVLAKYLLFRIPAWVVVVVSLLSACCWTLMVRDPEHLMDGNDGDGLTLGYWFLQAISAMPGALVGLAIGRVWREIGLDPWRSRVAWLGLAAVLGGWAVAFWSVAFPAWAHLSGAGLVLLSFARWNCGWVRLMAGWGRSAYGIYLVHVGWYLLLETLLQHRSGGTDAAQVMVNLLLTVVLSTITALWLERSRFTAWTIGSYLVGKP